MRPDPDRLHGRADGAGRPPGLRARVGAGVAAFAAAVVTRAARYPRVLLAGVALASVGLAWYAAGHLGINSSTVGMLDQKLPFIQESKRLDREFPQFSDLVVVVIDATAPADAADAARRLAVRLRREPELYPRVTVPGASEFFAHEGLLYLDVPQLQKLSHTLAEAQPFFGTLSADPTLHGLASVVGRALDAKLSPAQEAEAGRMFSRLADAADAEAHGRPGGVSWRHAMLGGSELSTAGSRSIVLVQPRLDHTRLRPGEVALETIRDTATEIGLDTAHGLRVRLTGSIALDDEEMQTVTRSTGLATVLSMVLVLVILVLGLRSPRLVTAILANLVVGLVWTAAFAAAAVGSLNLISVTFAVLFIGLGVDFGIQFGMRFREELARAGTTPLALERTGRDMGGAIGLAAGAAALSFFSFLPTEYRGLGELGLISGVGMLIALATTFTVLPAMLAAWPLPRDARAPRPGVLGAIGRAALGHRRAVVIATVIAALAAAATLPSVRFDFDPIDLKNPNNESVQTFHDLLRDPDATPYTSTVLAPDLAHAERVAHALERLPEVRRADTLASLVPSHQDEKLDIVDGMALAMATAVAPATPAKGNASERRAGFDALRADLARAAPHAPAALRAPLADLASALDAVAARFAGDAAARDHVLASLEHRFVGDLPKTLADLDALLAPKRVTLADLPATLRDRYVGVHGAYRVEVYPRDNLSNGPALRRFAAAVRSVAPDATDTPITLVAAGRIVVEACAEATGLAVAGAAVVLVLVLGRVRDAVVVLAPLALALLLTAATSVWLDVPFNFANVIAIPLLLGLGIAFGIYIVSRLREGVEADTLFATSTPRAVLFSALTTIACFGTLAFSPHRGMASMGTLLTAALCFALLCCLVVLPAVLGPRGWHADAE